MTHEHPMNEGLVSIISAIDAIGGGRRKAQGSPKTLANNAMKRFKPKVGKSQNKRRKMVRQNPSSKLRKYK